MLTPFSLASFAASKSAARAARRTSAELVESTPAGHRFPADAGYRAAAQACTAVLAAALVASSLFVIPPRHRRAPGTSARSAGVEGGHARR